LVFPWGEIVVMFYYYHHKPQSQSFFCVQTGSCNESFSNVLGSPFGRQRAFLSSLIICLLKRMFWRSVNWHLAITNWRKVWVWSSEADICHTKQSLLYIYRLWREGDECPWLTFHGRYKWNSWQILNVSHHVHQLSTKHKSSERAQVSKQTRKRHAFWNSHWRIERGRQYWQK